MRALLGVLATSLLAASNVMAQVFDYTIITTLDGKSYSGSFGGFQGGDLICESEDGGSDAGYVALLKGSTSLSDLDTVVNFYSFQGTLLFTASINEIFGNNPPNNLDEITDINGKILEIDVWTGADGNECQSRAGVAWNSERDGIFGGTGDPSTTASTQWINNGNAACGNHAYRKGLYCIKKKPSVRGDPHFVGFDGCRFDFDGEDGSVFAIYSDKNLQINALFQSLAVDVSDGNWMTKLGIRTGENSFILDPAIGLMHAENGSVLSSAGTVKYGSDIVTLSFNGHLVSTMTIDTPLMFMKAEVKRFNMNHDDFFINLSFELKSRPIVPHGVLGQTARPIVVNPNSNSASVRNCVGVEGAMEDYIVQDGILGTNFVYSTFGRNIITTSHQRRGIDVPIGSRAAVML